MNLKQFLVSKLLSGSLLSVKVIKFFLSNIIILKLDPNIFKKMCVIQNYLMKNIKLIKICSEKYRLITNIYK